MTNLAEELKAHFASKEELAELTKAMATTDDADAMITVQYDQELQKEVFHNSPFLSYIEQNGIVSPATTAKVGYRVKKQNTTSSFIGETEDIPSHVASNFEDKVAKMKTLVYPVEISDLAQNGVDAINLLEDEISDGYLDMAVAKDKAIIQGSGSNKDFEGLIPGIKTNKEDVGGDKLTLKDVDVIAQSIIDGGGSPSAILTTASVGRQLNDLIADRLRYVDKIELSFGHRVTAYNAPNGAQIPIIVDPNIDTTTNGQKLVFVDNNSIKMRELLPPSMIDLAKTKLSTSKVLYTWFTFYDRAEYRNGLLTNIGSDITPISSSTSTVSVTVNDGTNGVSSAKVKLTNTADSSKTYESTSSGAAGGCTISNVPYATYKVSVSNVPTGYTAKTYDNLVVDEATETLTVSLTKN